MKNIIELNKIKTGKILFNNYCDLLNENTILSSISGKKNIFFFISNGKHHFGMIVQNQTSFMKQRFYWDIVRNKNVLFYHVSPSGKMKVKKNVTINIIPLEEKICFYFDGVIFTLKIDGKGNVSEIFVFEKKKERIVESFECFVVFEFE